MAAPEIRPLPPAPLPNDSKTAFNAKAFQFVAALDVFRQDINAFGAYVGTEVDIVKTIRAPEDLAALPNAAGRSNRILGFNAGGAPVVHTYSSVRTLLNVADGATANATNAQLRDRATHTGMQPISSVSGLQSELNSRLPLSSVKPSLANPSNNEVPSTLAVASALAAVTSGSIARGAWNAATNSPALASGVGNAGWTYEVSVSGTTNLDGNNSWGVGDKAIFNGLIWTRIPASAVVSVDGRAGSVIFNFDTVSALASARASLPIGAVVSTRGCLSIGDGGHGTFDVVSSTTLTVDGHSAIGSSGKYLVLRPTNGVFQVEQFGAKGDGLNNDTAAFNRALARGLPVSIVNGKTYRASNISTSIGGFLYCEGAATIKNLAGLATHVLRNTGGVLYIKGITIDGSENSRHGLNVTGGGVTAVQCKFINSTHSDGFGIGANIDSSSLQSNFYKCEFSGSQYHGVAVLDSPHVVFIDCHGSNNGRNGFDINNYDLTLTKKIRRVEVTSCSASDNGGSGMVLGNPYVDHVYTSDGFGHTNNTCTNVTVSGFVARGNEVYGLVASCIGGAFSDVTVDSNVFGGLLVNGYNLTFSNTTITNNTVFGVDVGFGRQITFNGGRCTDNAAGVGGSACGFLLEAARDVQVLGMYLKGNGGVGSGAANMFVNAVGGTGNGRFFPARSQNIVLECTVDTTDGRRGLTVADAPYFVVDGNTYIGADPYLFTRYAATPDAVNSVGAKCYRNQFAFNSFSGGVLVVPDIPSHITTISAAAVSAIKTYSYDFFEGKVSYVLMSNQGNGYTASATTVTINGDGTGATGTAIVSRGSVLGVFITNHGSGYTSATVTITGDGTGAVATAKVGVDLPNSAEVQISFNEVNTVTRNNMPFINSPNSWALADFNVPAFGSFKMMGRYQNWLIVSSNADL